MLLTCSKGDNNSSVNNCMHYIFDHLGNVPSFMQFSFTKRSYDELDLFNDYALVNIPFVQNIAFSWYFKSLAPSTENIKNNCKYIKILRSTW